MKVQVFALTVICLLGSTMCAPNIVLNPPGAKSSDTYKKIFSEEGPVLSRSETLELLKEEAKNLVGSSAVIDRTRLVMVNKFIQFADISLENCDHLKNINWYFDHIDEKHHNILSYLYNIEKELHDMCYGKGDVVPIGSADSSTYKKIFYADAQVLEPEETHRLLKTETLRLSISNSEEDKAKKALVETCLSLAEVSKENCDNIEDYEWLTSTVAAAKHPNIKSFLTHYLKEQKAVC